MAGGECDDRAGKQSGSEEAEVEPVKTVDLFGDKSCILNLAQARDYFVALGNFIGQHSAFSVNDQSDFQRLANKLAKIHAQNTASLQQRQISQYFKPAEKRGCT